MKTLGITVENGQKVAARELTGNCTQSAGGTGDIVVDPETEIRWVNCGDDWQGGGTYSFLVTFEKKTTGDKWPFQSPARPGNVTLPIPPPPAAQVDTVLKKSVLRQEWKYTVDVDNDSYIKELDPMIIIRSKSALTAVAIAVAATLLVVAAVYLFRRLRPTRGT